MLGKQGGVEAGENGHFLRPTEYFYVGYAPENADYLKNRPVQASFTEIQQWSLDNYGFKTGSMYVYEVK